MAGRADPVSVIERCYRRAQTEEEWLQAVVDDVSSAMPADFGWMAYRIWLAGPHVRFGPVHTAGDPPSASVETIETMTSHLNRVAEGRSGLVGRTRAAVYRAVCRSLFREPVDRILLSEHQRIGPTWMYTLGAPVDDLVFLRADPSDCDELTVLVGGLGRRGMSPARRRMGQMLVAHVKSAQRLHRRIPGEGAPELPPGGAVLDGAGRVLEAAGDARDAIEPIERAVRRVDRARSRASGRTVDAMTLWEGLIEGRWTLVERFDTDGKRLLLLHRNEEGVQDPRGLTPMECRVVALAVRGHSDKMIGYHLGVAPGTVSSHLASAMRKLRMTSRIELLRTLGRRYPREPL